MFETTMKLKSIQNPMTPKLLSAPMLQPISIPLKRCDAPASIKLPVNFPYCPVEKQIKIPSRKQSILPAEDGSTTNVRTNICRYQLTRKLTSI